MTRLALIFLLSLQAHAVTRHPANIVGDVDGRGAITILGPKIGLSPAEITQIRSAVGYFVCPGTEHGNEVGATGFLIREDVVVTVAHAFYDDKGVQRGPWKECYFQTQDGRSQRVKIDPLSIRVGTSSPAKVRWSDYALVKLQSPITTALPLTVVQPEMILTSWMQVFQVGSHREAPYYKNESEDEPIVQTCNVRQPFPRTKKYPASNYSDCDSTAGGSGGPHLVRLQNGQLVVAGIVAAGGNAGDFVAYGETPGKSGQPTLYSLSYAIQISGPLLEMAQSMLSAKSQSAMPLQKPAAPRAREGVTSGFLNP